MPSRKNQKIQVRRLQSPWAFHEAVVECPRCRSQNVHRIFDRWGRLKGVQMFQCVSCGKKYYTRGIALYSPTFSSKRFRRY